MNNSIRIFLTGFFLSSFLGSVYAQSNECSQTLSHAESEFNAGHFYAIPSILQPCLDGGLTREQNIRAYLLLCQAYLIIDDPIAADDSYLKLLHIDPEFIPNDKDHPIDIVYLSKKFTATPIFTPHFRLGMNTSFYRTIYSLSTEPYGVSADNTLRLGFQIGGGIDWNINDFLSLCSEIDFSTRGFDRSREGVSGGDKQSVLASQNWIDIPLYLKYSYFLNSNIRLFGYGGIAINYLMSAKNEFIYTDNKPSGSQVVATGPSESVIYQRNQFNRSWIIGGGVKYKWGKDFLYADLRYMGGLSNMAAEDQLYYTQPSTIDKNQIGDPAAYLSSNVTKYRYVSDLFRMDNLSLSFGFIHPIYDPRKVKRAKTKSVSRQIEREEGGKKK
ncbi:MAG TPA: porin family protein [Cyclobacteriaceae bacterium]|nr:porin family protein [Cyclobacteriaceae bacterium]